MTDFPTWSMVTALCVFLFGFNVFFHTVLQSQLLQQKKSCRIILQNHYNSYFYDWLWYDSSGYPVMLSCNHNCRKISYHLKHRCLSNSKKYCFAIKMITSITSVSSSRMNSNFFSEITRTIISSVFKCPSYVLTHKL